jgi:hypothetical protein
MGQLLRQKKGMNCFQRVPGKKSPDLLSSEIINFTQAFKTNARIPFLGTSWLHGTELSFHFTQRLLQYKLRS